MMRERKFGLHEKFSIC